MGLQIGEAWTSVVQLLSITGTGALAVTSGTTASAKASEASPSRTPVLTSRAPRLTYKWKTLDLVELPQDKDDDHD